MLDDLQHDERSDALDSDDAPGSSGTFTIGVPVGRFLVTFDPSKYTWELLDEPCGHGVLFVHDGFYIQAFCHEHLRERMIINKRPEDGYGRDMPFHLGTAHFLPPGVSVLSL